MPLNASALGDELMAAASAYNNITVANETELAAKRQQFFADLAAAIVNHITVNAVVTGTVVTTGSATTQTGPIASGRVN